MVRSVFIGGGRMPTRYSFGRVSDAVVLRLMDELINSFDVSSASVDLGDLASFSVKNSTEEGVDDGDRAQFSGLMTEDSYFITRMVWQATSTAHSVSFHRKQVWGTNSGMQQTWVDSPTPYIDSIEVKSSAKYAAFFLTVVKRYVSMAPPITGSEAGTAFDQSQDILNRVSAAVSTLVEHTSDRQKDLDQTRFQISEDAEKKIAESKKIADEAINSIANEFAEKESDLKKRELELDDRANTHVRREFAKQMATLSDTRLSSNLLAKSNISFSIPVLISAISVLFLAWLIFSEINYVSLLSGNISEITRDQLLKESYKPTLISSIDSQILFAQVRMALQSVGIAALVWFALRLASSRYALVSGWERDLHKFRLDTERAGFLVEGDLEARKVNDVGLPEVLLESFSRNLFAGSDFHSNDAGGEGLGSALHALLGQAAKVRVGPDGVSVEVEGRGIKRARKLIAEGEG